MKSRSKLDLGRLLHIEKTCDRCRKSKPLYDFPERKSSPDGAASVCKKCKTPLHKRAKLPKGSKFRICACCDRKLEKSDFAKMEWREEGIDSTCRSCRIILRIEKGISKWVHEFDLTPEEIVAARLLSETRTLAKAMCVTHTLDWGWFLDQIEPWRCADTGVRLAPARRGGRGAAFEPTVKLINPRRGFIMRNCSIVARRPK